MLEGLEQREAEEANQSMLGDDQLEPSTRGWTDVQARHVVKPSHLKKSRAQPETNRGPSGPGMVAAKRMSCAGRAAGIIRNIRTARPRKAAGADMPRDNTKRRGNYDSGEDYVLEYGELRFTFNEEDFRQRVEQAAVKLNFVEPGLGLDELEDLVNLAVNGEIREPVSRLGEHVNDRWYDLVGPADRSLVHWLRRLVFRGAWLDQRVKEGELDVYFHEDTQSFGYVQRDRDSELIELSPEPSWQPAAYRR